MQLKRIQVRQSINKAWLKVKPNRSAIDAFKIHLLQCIDLINESESEEHHKKLVSDFLEETYYRGKHYINTKGRNDQVIHNGKEPQSTVGVIIEAKKPTNKAEMLSKENINTKAFQELVLYYLRERITQNNLEIKHLIATNVYEWFVFDAAVFEKTFAQNKALVKKFEEFEAKRLSGTDTSFFYNHIAKPFIEQLSSPIEFTWFDLRAYEKPLRNNDKKDDAKLIALFKAFSPEHLLKLPFANDSNSLDSRFYKELLHLIGLDETKDGSKKVIQRPKSGHRHAGSLLENAIDHLESRDKLSRLSNISQYGGSKEERLFNVGLELCITWVNRILFLKLLEAQLLSYHNADAGYTFLNKARIKDYDELDSLFFEVLAVRPENRRHERLARFAHVPYLNSSLFEPTNLEHDTLFISNLADNRTLPILSGTVLKGEHGKKRTGELNAIEYLFAFLDAYDFSSEGGEDIQEDNKTLINASVLGLIFEKINGYKDGSFFTPGFITMYMCRETIRRAVVQKFNETKGWVCESLDEVYDQIEDRNEANAIINSLKICDPAVGSGHFLVSALNEILAIKHDLNILQDRSGRRLKEYELEVVNDELIITDENGELFEYHPGNSESQRVQETLFHEKQTIIEHCLFGVDINPNSVKICRLRLWIELLKHAYYKSADAPVIPRRMPGSGSYEKATSSKQILNQVQDDDVKENREGHRQLETLPNIDINIKTGNSLISRFALDADLKEALKTSKWSISSYRAAVDTYRNARSKEEKREMERLMDDIKSSFRTEIASNDPKVLRLKKMSAELVKLTTQTGLFEQTAKQKKAWQKKADKLTTDSKKLETEIEEIKSNKIFENAFEWRFEFPEVLNNDGDFVGFDVVIGNPPYVRHEEIKEFKIYFSKNFEVYVGTADLYVYFYELSHRLSKYRGFICLITANKFMRTNYGRLVRDYLTENTCFNKLIDFGELPVFEEAATFPLILLSKFEKRKKQNFEFYQVKELVKNDFSNYLSSIRSVLDDRSIAKENWTLSSPIVLDIIDKIERNGTLLEKFINSEVKYGIKTGFNKAFIIDEHIKNELVSIDKNSNEIIKPVLKGDDIRHYQIKSQNYYIILTKIGIEIDRYPAIKAYLDRYESKLDRRYDKGKFWWELRSCDYYDEFERGKIIYPDIAKESRFTLDTEGHYLLNTAYLIPSNDLSLLAILNSKLIYYYFTKISASLGDPEKGGRLRWFRQYVNKIPIATFSNESKGTIESKVTQILSLKKENPQADTSALEAEIDQMVYQLYGLTEQEIAIVEENVR